MLGSMCPLHKLIDADYLRNASDERVDNMYCGDFRHDDLVQLTTIVAVQNINKSIICIASFDSLSLLVSFLHCVVWFVTIEIYCSRLTPWTCRLRDAHIAEAHNVTWKEIINKTAHLLSVLITGGWLKDGWWNCLVMDAWTDH